MELPPVVDGIRRIGIVDLAKGPHALVKDPLDIVGIQNVVGLLWGVYIYVVRGVGGDVRESHQHG